MWHRVIAAPVDDTVRVVALPARADAPLIETSNARVHLIASTAPMPPGADVFVGLADGRRIVYEPLAAGGPPSEINIDPFVSGNSFKPLHASERALAAQLSIAAGRRVDSGPESERVFLVLRGSGLVFVDEEGGVRYDAEHIAYVPAGLPARLWSQGPQDVLAIVFQPRGEPVPRRTLASEIAKRRGAEPAL